MKTKYFTFKMEDGYVSQKERDEYMQENDLSFLWRLLLHGFSKSWFLKFKGETILSGSFWLNHFYFGPGIFSGGAPLARGRFYVGICFLFFSIQIYPYNIIFMKEYFRKVKEARHV